MFSRKLLLISRDPGATNQMVAVNWLALNKKEWCRFPKFSKKLFGREQADVDVVIAAEPLAVPAWQGCKITEVSEKVDPRQILVSEKITHLVSGLDDIDAVTSRLFWEAARELHIPILTLCDNDINILIRCVDSEGNRFWPDHVLARNALGVAEIPQEIVTVEGDLYHSYLKAHGGGAHDLRPEWGICKNETVVLFVSQNCQEMRDIGRDYPYSEFRELNKLIGYLNSGHFPPRVPIKNPVLVIRPHPRDAKGKYNKYERREYGDGLRVIVSQQGTSTDAIFSVNIVAGMRSAVLEEAKLLGRETVSLLEVEEGLK